MPLVIKLVVWLPEFNYIKIILFFIKKVTKYPEKRLIFCLKILYERR